MKNRSYNQSQPRGASQGFIQPKKVTHISVPTTNQISRRSNINSIAEYYSPNISDNDIGDCENMPIASQSFSLKQRSTQLRTTDQRNRDII